MNKIVMGISGASGVDLALVVLQALNKAQKEVHLIISQGAKAVIATEGVSNNTHTDYLQTLKDLSHKVYDIDNIGASPASGSWKHMGMLICPCSMASLAAIATGVGHNLIHRSADVCLKERRPLVLVSRETPLSGIHLKNMLTAHEAGAIIFPPCPAFYAKPQNINEILEHLAGRILDQFNIEHKLGRPWQ